MAGGLSLRPVVLMAFLFVNCCWVTTANPVKRHMNHKELCGRHLAEALRKTCVSYRGHFSSDTPPGKGNPTAAKWSNPDVGIVDECCFKRCNFSQLSQYCAESKELTFAEQGKMVDLNLVADEDDAVVAEEATDAPSEAEVTYIDFEDGPLILVPLRSSPHFAPYAYDSLDSRYYQ